VSPTEPQPVSQLADLGVYILSGRIKEPAQGLAQGVDADRLGLRRAWLSERYDLKEAGAILGGVGALTRRLGLATCAIAPGSRHPLLTAALGATMQATYGPRFTLGIGRGIQAVLEPQGMREFTFAATEDYVSIVRRLWSGETVSYDGPAGTYPQLKLVDGLAGPPPDVWSVNIGGRKASQAAARSFDGAFLTPFLTPKAVAQTRAWIDEECDRIGRDPAEVRVCQPIVTAPEMDSDRIRNEAHARAITYFQMPGIWRQYRDLNGWDPEVFDQVRNHEMFARLGRSSSADQHFTRDALAEPARLVPDEWVRQTCAVGDIADCLHTMQAFKDAGADELAIYGTTPAENEVLIAAWRTHTNQRP
jgi:probable F420-dependent oxidoreductase